MSRLTERLHRKINKSPKLQKGFICVNCRVNGGYCPMHRKKEKCQLLEVLTDKKSLSMEVDSSLCDYCSRVFGECDSRNDGAQCRLYLFLKSLGVSHAD